MISERRKKYLIIVFAFSVLITIFICFTVYRKLDYSNRCSIPTGGFPYKLSQEESYKVLYEILDAQEVIQLEDFDEDIPDKYLELHLTYNDRLEKESVYIIFKQGKHFYCVNREKRIVYMLNPSYANVISKICSMKISNIKLEL